MYCFLLGKTMNKKDIKLSIIIPVYNSGRYLEECLSNVLSYRNFEFEIILIDDGSTDDSNLICIELQKKYKFIKYFYKDNGGVSRARNLGIQQAKGKYITFVDSDDVIENNYIDLIYDMIEKNNSELYWFGSYSFDSTGKNDIDNSWMKKGIMNAESREIKKLIAEQRFNHVWDKVFISSIIKRNKIYFPVDISMGEDLIFQIEYLKNCRKIYSTPETLYGYRISLEGASCNPKISYLNDIDYMWKSIFDFIGEEDRDLTEVAFDNMLSSFTMQIGNLSKIGVKKIRLQDELNGLKFYQRMLQHKFKKTSKKIKIHILLIKWYFIYGLVVKIKESLINKE